MQQALRTVIVSPDQETLQHLQRVLDEIGGTTVVRVLECYPTENRLAQLLRSHEPQVVFVSIDCVERATDIASQITTVTPNAQVVAIGRSCDAITLMEIMRAGIREYLGAPFERTCTKDCLVRLLENVSLPRVASQSADLLYASLL